MQGEHGHEHEHEHGHEHGHGKGNVAHFMPGEIVVAVTPPSAEFSPMAILENLVKESSPVQQDEVLRAALAHRSRVTAFSDKLALVITRLHGQDASDEAVLDRINRLNRQLDRHGGGQVVGFTPNWHSSSCPGTPGPGGGPGGEPVAPAASPKPGDGHFQLPASFLSEVGTGGGQGAAVAVLDTLPSAVDLRRAYDAWHSDNWLIQALLGNPNSFQTHAAGGMHLLQTVDYALKAHSYPMPDHGLFVSGIVRAIAPQAEIHLIETLNPYGVGNLESVANAFRLVYRLAGLSGQRPIPNAPVPPSDVVSLDSDHPQSPNANQPILPAGRPVTPFVVNCSFMFNAPMHVKHHFLRQSGDERLKEAGEGLKRIWKLLDPLLDPKNPQSPLAMFAAAGNDGNADDVQTGEFPPARYPAAFNTVTGAGALNRDDTPAMYTDQSDLPDSVGYATFGGSVDTGTSTGSGEHYIADGVNGMLGIYAGPVFPDGTPNTTGWARWAGTSFAAPILSGACALGLPSSVAAGKGAHGALGTIGQASIGGSSGGAGSPIGPIFHVAQS